MKILPTAIQSSIKWEFFKSIHVNILTQATRPWQWKLQTFFIFLISAIGNYVHSIGHVNIPVADDGPNNVFWACSMIMPCGFITPNSCNNIHIKFGCCYSHYYRDYLAFDFESLMRLSHLIKASNNLSLNIRLYFLIWLKSVISFPFIIIEHSNKHEIVEFNSIIDWIEYWIYSLNFIWLFMMIIIVVDSVAPRVATPIEHISNYWHSLKITVID